MTDTKKIEGFDLSTLEVTTAANQGFAVEITHPTSGADLGIKITVCGTDSDVYHKIQRKQQNVRLSNMRKSRNINVNAEELENEGLAILVACTRSWEGVKEGTKELEFNAENVKNVYVKYPWLREQIEFAMSDRSNFIRA